MVFMGHMKTKMQEEVPEGREDTIWHANIILLSFFQVCAIQALPVSPSRQVTGSVHKCQCGLQVC